MMSRGFLGVLMGLCWGKDLNSRWIRCFTAGATTSRTLRLWSSGVYSEICSQNRGLFQAGQSPGFVRRARWKSTDLAASLRQAFGDDFLLVSNEVMRSRVSVLADNIALWGDPNVVVTSVDPKAFARLEGFSTSLSQMFLALAKECSARMPRLSRIGRKM